MKSNLIKYCLGCDIDSKKIMVVLVSLDQNLTIKIIGSRSFSNTPLGHRNLVAWASTKHKNKTIPLTYVMEATGIYYEQLAYYLKSKHQSLSVVLANKARKYMQSLGLRSKTDKIDAKGLATMGAQQKLKKWEPINNLCYELKKLTRHRESLKKHITQIKNQLHAESYAQRPNQIVINQQHQLIENYELMVKQTEDAIEKMTASNPSFERKTKQIADSVKGLGFLSVVTVVAEMNAFTFFDNKRQLTSFCGYDVIENQSGKRVGKTRISKKGNSHVRRALYFPAMNVVRFQVAPFEDLFYRVMTRTNIYKKANVAVQRKLLCLIYTLWKADMGYLEEYYKLQVPKSLSPLSISTDNNGGKQSSPTTQATLDEPQYTMAPEVLFPK